MRISFVFPYNTWGGAYRSTFELSNGLIKKGHDVTIYFCIFDPAMKWEQNKLILIKSLCMSVLRSLIRGKNVPWFDLKARVRLIPLISDSFILDADVIVATHWQTVIPVMRLNQAKGHKFHYVRDIEQWASYFPHELSAFKCQATKIAVSDWVKSYLVDTLGMVCDYVIGNGTNCSLFKCGERRRSIESGYTLGLLYADHPMKSVNTGIDALKKIKALNPSVNIILFGFPRDPKIKGMTYQYVHRPIARLLAEVYNRVDIFITVPLQEGFGNTPLEAMCSGCAVVATRTGFVGSNCTHRENIMFVDFADIDGIVNGVVELLQDRNLLDKVSSGGRTLALANTWKKSVSALEAVFESTITSGGEGG